VWIPMFPADRGPAPGPVTVLAKSFHINNEADLHRLYQQRTMTGVITNAIHGLGSAEVAELKKSYPGADFASVQVIEEGREFPTEQKLFLELGAAAALIVVGAVAGVVLLAVKRRKRAQAASAAEEAPG